MQWGSVEERVIDLKNARQVAGVREFLAKFDLTFSTQPDYTIGLFREGKMIATGSLGGEVLRNIAVDEALQGEGLTAAVVSSLISEAGRRGVFHYFIFTKPSKAHLFSSLGFAEVGRAEPYAVLLESGLGSVDVYCREMKKLTAFLPETDRAGLVMNCNPFTLGHQAVIAKAAAENAGVIVMAVSEDKSVFPFDVRFRLMKEALAGLDNVAVIPGGKYMVSAATFPGYFTKTDETVLAQTQLDARIFGGRIAPGLGITSRYVGNEPYCQVTNAYNAALTKILPEYGIKVKVMERLAVKGEAVSASRVRQLIAENKWKEIETLVPEVVYQYLISPEAAPVVDKIIHNQSRH